MVFHLTRISNINDACGLTRGVSYFRLDGIGHPCPELNFLDLGVFNLDSFGVMWAFLFADVYYSKMFTCYTHPKEAVVRSSTIMHPVCAGSVPKHHSEGDNVVRSTSTHVSGRLPVPSHIPSEE